MTDILAIAIIIDTLMIAAIAAANTWLICTAHCRRL